MAPTACAAPVTQAPVELGTRSPARAAPGGAQSQQVLALRDLEHVEWPPEPISRLGLSGLLELRDAGSPQHWPPVPFAHAVRSLLDSFHPPSVSSLSFLVNLISEQGGSGAVAGEVGVVA